MTGREEIYLGEDRGNPEAFAHMAIDAGASLVIASGPHVLRGLQFYQGHLIAYSLGNFAGYGNFSIHGNMTMSAILRVTLSSSGRFERARLYPVEFAGTGRPVPGGGAISFVARLSAADFGASAARVRSSGVITRGEVSAATAAAVLSARVNRPARPASSSRSASGPGRPATTIRAERSRLIRCCAVTSAASPDESHQANRSCPGSGAGRAWPRSGRRPRRRTRPRIPGPAGR